MTVLAWLPCRCAAIALGGALAVGLLACPNLASTECFCDTSATVTILAPAGAVTAVKLGGACAAAMPVCQGTSSDVYPVGCAETLLFPRQAGDCAIEIDLSDGGVVRKSVVLTDPGDSCCTGPRIASPEAGTIDLGSGDGGVNAG
jgi:hypothetical protein